MSLRATFSRGLRSAGLLGTADDMVAQLDRLRTHRARNEFIRENPGFVLPPALLAYDAFGSSEPAGYRLSGQVQAQYIAELINRYRLGAQVICEWGCGPMRVLRHMPTHFPDARLIGLDYNPLTIAWSAENFPQIRFLLNDLDPPLPLADGEAEVIYSISVFTHLSQQRHYAYVADLMRCLRPGGILIVTLHGDRYADKMTAAERALYEQGKLVTRDRAREGKRTFAAFHNPAFVRSLFEDFQILEHDTADRIPRFWQDTWVMRRR